ncbi:coiled-coil domain-containing protein 158-like isoform X2 [Takifugu flavidus]|uniref:coiled-coil domain-containing protein 158-like isoform X2 n=1 Tax=Takifugu flavidus TaxID=433684 RepID=UPI00254495FC|nr:coiled-coil domain-containing protein 158-like isoform X2 [Takifugu flavidus]
MSLFALSSRDSVHVKQPNRTNAATTSTDTHTTSSQPRLNSLTLDQLSEELDRRTKETQKLQDEVENATKQTLEKFGCAYEIHCSGSHDGNCNILADDPAADSGTVTIQQQVLTPPLTCHKTSQLGGSCSGEEFVGESLQQLWDIPLKEENDPHKPERTTFGFDKVIMNLQRELQKAQREKDVLTDLRLMDSAEHVGQMEKMLSMLEELQNTERAKDQKMSETENQASSINKRVEKLEQNMKERFFSPLSPNEHSEKVWPLEHHGGEEYSGRIEQKEGMDDLIANLGQEMALLTHNLSTSKNSTVNFITKLEMLKNLTEKQTLLHQAQVCGLVSAVSRHKTKVCYLEQQLIQAQSQLKDTQREREHFLQQSEDVRTQLDQLKQQSELQEEVKALRRQLEDTGEEKKSLHSQLEQRTHEEMKTKDLLEEKEMELRLLKQETQQHLDRLEGAERRYQTLHVDREALGQKVDDQEKMINILRLQVENNTQVTVQQGQTINILHQENSFLNHQLNQHKLNVQQLRNQNEIDQYKTDLVAAELERQRLQGSVAEHVKHLQEQHLEKQQLTNQLELQKIEFSSLKKEHRELQQLHTCKKEEYEGVVLKLQSRMKRANDELEQVRDSLRTLKEANGHGFVSGLNAAVNTQERVIARREQINSLEGKIQNLVQTVEKLNQEKHHQNLEHQRQLQELAFIKEEKRQLGRELEALRSKDKRMREWTSRLEQILHKMSERFAECQDFIQLQEHEFFHLKLQCSLDSKELQGQHLHTALHEPTAHLGRPPAASTPLSSQENAHARISPKRKQDGLTQELTSLVEELKAVISENRRPHTDNNGSSASRVPRRRSAPERVNRTAFSTNEADEVKAGLRYRRKTSGSEPHFPKASEVNWKTINTSFKDNPRSSSPALAARCPSSTDRLLLGRKSPVYYLLTSEPNQPSH